MSDETCDGGLLDGFHIGQVPVGVGDEVSDFASEWDDVRFASRVWERQVPDGYRADLRVHVLRGDRLTDLTALRDFLCGYHERDPVEWRLVEFPHGDGLGLTDGVQAFWLVEPGVAVSVLTVPELSESLLPTALSVRAGSSSGTV
ncbi:hypothetical protein KIF24_00210 [Micromonospora sp. Llam7]|uniref:hypothetical protein n=1 Tax=Micromonospora tarapacensis TaxID=2835305 RepID=UPI001C83F750|nr:hypothetical protein [Micromonospora tarapacensis]MBX7264635.1 hypothetical protein [Micromonospora tarapacensis]